MGYTHYFEGIGPLTPEFVADVQKIVDTAEAQGIRICGWDGNGAPLITVEEVALNGTDDLSHESFNLGGPDWAFCKTARKPYDAVVVGAILVAAKKHYPTARISSDGEWDDTSDHYGTWQQPRALYLAALGEEPSNPLT